MKTMVNKNEVIEMYKKIREKHGDKAKSILWLNTHGHSKVNYCLQSYLKMNWSDFKKEAGFNDKDKKRGWSKEDAIKTYREIRSKYGDKGRSYTWMKTNNHGDLCQYCGRVFRSWNDFKKEAGFNEEPLHKSWTKEKAIKEYQEIIKKYGDKAKNSKWLYENGYQWLYRQIKNNKMTWREFVDNCK